MFAVMYFVWTSFDLDTSFERIFVIEMLNLLPAQEIYLSLVLI